MVSKVTVCTTAGGFTFLVGAVLFILGFTIQDMVKTKINNGVKSAIKLTPDMIDDPGLTNPDSTWYKYVYDDTDYTFWAYNLTNLNEVQQGKSPRFDLKGPYIYKQKNAKYNMSFTSDFQLFKYNEWSRWEAITAGSTTDQFTNINPAYLALLKGPLQILDDSSVFGYNSEALVSEHLLRVLLAETVLNKMNTLVIPGLKQFAQAALLPTLMTGVQFVLETYCKLTQLQVELQWFNLTSPLLGPLTNNASCLVYFSGTAGQTLAGWELNYTGTTSFDMGPVLTILFNSSSSYSLLSATGVGTWLKAKPYTNGDSITQYLMNGLGILSAGQSGLNLTKAIYNWMQSYMFASASASYEYPAVTFFSQGLTQGSTPVKGGVELLLGLTTTSYKTAWDSMWGNISADLAATPTFDTLAYYQFSTSVATLAAGLTSSAAAYSLNDIVPNSITGYPMSAGGLHGPEYGSYLWTHSLSSSTRAVGQLALGTDFACPGFPSTLTNDSIACTVAMNYLSAKQMKSFLDVYGNNTNVSYPVTGGLSAFLNYMLKGQDASGAFAAHGAVGTGLLAYWSTVHMPFWNVLYAGNFNDSGSSGMFVTRSIDQMIHGWYDYAFDQIEGGNFPGLFPDYTSQADHYSKTKQGLYSLYTGTSNINIARWYQAYKGVSQFQKFSDLLTMDQSKAWNCFLFDPKNSCNVYQSAEVIDKSTEFLYTYPFQEGHPPVPYFSNVWLSDVYRSVNLNYTNDIVVKGITLRRYILDYHLLQPSSENSANVKYNYPTPQDSLGQVRGGLFGSMTIDGLYPGDRVQEGLPIFFSLATFLHSNQTLFTQNNLNITNSVNDPANNYVGSGYLTGSSSIQTTNPYWEVELDIEPLSGVLMDAHKRFQANFAVPAQWIAPSNATLNAIFGPNLFPTIPPAVLNDKVGTGAIVNTNNIMLFPYIIIDERGTISDKDASAFKSAVYDNRSLADDLMIVGIVVGAFLMAFSVVCTAIMWKRLQGHSSAMTSLNTKSDLTM